MSEKPKGIACLFCGKEVWTTDPSKSPDELAKQYKWWKVKISNETDSFSGYCCRDCFKKFDTDLLT